MNARRVFIYFSYSKFFGTSLPWKTAQTNANLCQYSTDEVLLQSAAIVLLLKQAFYLQQNIKIPQNGSCNSEKLGIIFYHCRPVTVTKNTHKLIMTKPSSETKSVFDLFKVLMKNACLSLSQSSRSPLI